MISLSSLLCSGFCVGGGLLALVTAAPGQSRAGAAVPPARPTAVGPVADFRDLAAAAGLTARSTIGGERTKDYILETTGGGVAILDYDDDGWADIFLVNGSTLAESPAADAPANHLYRNNGDGTFADVTGKAGLAASGWGQGVCAGDYDNDGHLDLFVTYYGRQVLYRNNGDGTFTDVTRASGLPASSPRWNTGAAFLDFDRDGRLDLFVSAYVAYDDATRYPPGSRPDCFWKSLSVMCGPKGLGGSHNALFRGNADGTFTDVSEPAGLLKVAPGLRLHPARFRLRQRRLARRLRRERLQRVIALPQQPRRHLQGSGPAGRRRAHGRRPRAGGHGRQLGRL